MASESMLPNKLKRHLTSSCIRICE